MRLLLLLLTLLCNDLSKMFDQILKLLDYIDRIEVEEEKNNSKCQLINIKISFTVYNIEF